MNIENSRQRGVKCNRVINAVFTLRSIFTVSSRTTSFTLYISTVRYVPYCSCTATCNSFPTLFSFLLNRHTLATHPICPSYWTLPCYTSHLSFLLDTPFLHIPFVLAIEQPLYIHPICPCYWTIPLYTTHLSFLLDKLLMLCQGVLSQNYPKS